MPTPPADPNAPGPLLDPAAAIAAMAAALTPVGVERVPLHEATGRILAEAVHADRDSPACDVSAMDGYAVRLDALKVDPEATHAVATEVVTGAVAIPMPAHGVVRVFTGGAVPEGADAVVKREDTIEEPDRIRFRAGVTPRPGQHIRRRGENTAAGDIVLEPGVVLHAAQIASLANFGHHEVSVYRRVCVAVLVTGNEVVDASFPGAGEVRDSNGPTLAALVRSAAWCELVHVARVGDTPEATVAALKDALSCSDAVLTTGGVSKGDHDYVPDAMRTAGCRVVYHGLAMRPGKPNLGAIGPGGQAVFGLPGNPVSAAVGAVALAGPVLRTLAGCGLRPGSLGQESDRLRFSEGFNPRVAVMGDDGKTLGLWWYRLATLDAEGCAVLTDNRGSGDVAALGRSDGFVEVPPDTRAADAPRRWFGWGW